MLPRTPIFLLIVTLFLLPFQPSALAQDSAPAVISAPNIPSLHPVMTIQFADIPADYGQVQNGWFALSPDGSHIAVINRANQILFWDATNGFSPPISPVCAGGDDKPGAFVDGAFGTRGFAAAYINGSSAYTAVINGDSAILTCRWADFPVRIWQPDDQIGLEMMPQDGFTPPYIAMLPIGAEASSATRAAAPDSDPNAFLRIGRIDPPYAITITRDNRIQRWMLDTGTVNASAQLPALPGMGALTPDGRYFGWRDGESQGVYWLDFETGENHLVAPLNGVYIPFMQITMGGDVILTADGGGQPTLVAWDTHSGQRYELGNRRACGRQPDLVRISRDGTALVIGCDKGLEVWRVAVTP